MDLRPEFIDLSKPNDLLALKKHLSEMADELDILYSTTAPNGTISARQGRICLYNNSGTYSYWINTTGATVWVEISNQTLWQVDGTETQLKTADEIDMQSKKIINVTDPASAQDASTKNYTDGKISKTTAGEIAAMTEKTTLVDADLFLIEDSAASNAKKKILRSTIGGIKLTSATALSGVNNSGDITIAASKIYKVVISLTNISADDTVKFRINSDGGSNYTDLVDGNTTYITVGQMEGDSTAKNVLTAEFILDTRLGGSTGFARILGTVLSFNSATTALMLQDRGGSYQPAAGAPTSFEIYSSGGATLTGNIYVYEMPLS